MTEKSYFWGGTTVGDATDSPYDSDEFSDIWRKLLQRDRAEQGPIEGYENELAVTNPSGSTVRVATGAALVDGTYYENDTNVDNTISTPAVLTRIDRVVLRKTSGSQEVRIAILTGVEGGGVPALTQTNDVTWEVPLAQVSITTVPVLTVTDEREYSRTPLADSVAGSMIHIETILGDDSSTDIDFTGIAATYRHLFIVGQIRLVGAVVDADVNMRFNGDGGTNYHEQDIFGASTTPTATAAASQNEAKVGTYPGASATANYVGQIIIDIANYAGSTFFKSWVGTFSSVPDTAIANFDAGNFGGIWLDASTITRVTLISSSGNFDDGTEISLYGIT